MVEPAGQAARHRAAPILLRLGKDAKREVGRPIHTGGRKQAMRHLRKLKTFLGRPHRDLGRKLEAQPGLCEISAGTMEIVARLLAQKPDDKHKLYALHAPEVECIGKGKPHTPVCLISLLAPAPAKHSASAASADAFFHGLGHGGQLPQ